MKKKYIALLSFIVILAAFLRFWQLGFNPPSLTWDEVAWGYNAYSLGIDGKDEFGKLLPYDYLESFGDFKPPVYAYLAIIPVKLFGLNEFAVRFPSALFGSLTVFLTYLLIKRIFEKDDIALLSAFLLAISPWHINLSRAAFEANVASFFIVLGIWFFLESLGKKKWYIVFAAIAFCISIYTFNSARVVAPLLVIVLGIAFRKKLWERKKQTFIAALVGFVLILPVVQFLFSPQASLRYQEVNIFSDSKVIERTNQEIKNDKNIWWSKILHNRRITFSVEYLKHYFDNFNPDFLFIKGDGNPKFSTQDVGQLYIWELPFFLAGIYILFRKREGKWWIIPAWLLLSIIPAATARETPHALRIETSLPTFQILSAIGLASFLSHRRKSLAIFAVFSLLFVNVLYYLHSYYAHYPQQYSSEWQYGYKPVLTFVEKVKKDYDAIYITESLGRPYVYVLFYTRYDPVIFRKEAIINREALGFVHVNAFGKYFFKKDLLSLQGLKRILYVDTLQNVPQNANVLEKFPLLDGSGGLVAYTL